MRLVHSIASWIMKKRLHSIELFMQYPEEVQGDVLEQLVQRATPTSWGETYDYASINGRDDFVRRVPLQDYKSLEPWITRMMEGERHTLWPGKTKWFAQSSGTSGGPRKFIPVSKESLENCHFKGGKDMLALYLANHSESSLFEGKNLIVGGSTQVHELNPNAYYGDLSSIIIRNFPFWAQFRQAARKSLTLLPDWESKLQQITERVCEEDVTMISGVPSWNVVLLRRVLVYSGAKTIAEVWPNLELYVWGGMSLGIYKEQFNRLLGKSINYLQTYNASEGFFGIQDRFSQGTDDMLLMLDYGIYYEFIPESSWNDEQPKTLAIHEVALEERYELVISTNGGLWRYRTGDVVQFTSLSPFRIKVAGRTSYSINLVGEELMEPHVQQVLPRVCDKYNAEIEEYTIGPSTQVRQGVARHEWLIEWNRAPLDLKGFTRDLDEGLMQANCDYAAKRHNDLVLEELHIKSLQQGHFYQWLSREGRLGGQVKVPRMRGDRSILDSVLTAQEL